MSASEAASARVKHLPVLIVEDEPSMLEMIVAVLHHAGFTNLRTARNGLDALWLMGIPHPQLQHRGPPPEPRPVDLVILDIMLPDIVGFEVCLHIKNRLSRTLPVMLMTGFPIETHHASFVESGADDFLTKPFRPPELVARATMHLNRRWQEAQTALLHDTTQPQATQRSGSGRPGALLGVTLGDYRITGSISWSGSSLVLSAEAIADGSRRVVKMLAQPALEFADVVRRFALETQIMRGLDHPNLVRIEADGTYQGCPYYIMEYLGGRSLELLVAGAAPAPGAVVLPVARDLARALDYIHGKQIVHRDVKPKNVYLLDDGIAKLGDFGIAVVLGDLRVTQEGYSIGTPIYMAPEQFDGTAVSPATDIYSYGATLYHLIAGKPPFLASSAMEMLRQHLTMKPPSLTTCRKGLPAGWDELIVERCLAKKPADRPASMHEVLAALDALGGKDF